jgi:hypothetical protein
VIRISGRERNVWCGECGSHDVKKTSGFKRGEKLHKDVAVLYDELSKEYLEDH